jgi:hypothetical protein
MPTITPALLAIAACTLVTQLAGGAAAPLTTLAERSGFERTGRYAEVEQLCQAFQQKWPDRVRCMEFGRSAEGRPMLALVASDAQLLDAAANKRAGQAVVLMQGAIHAGEVDGKDAGFLALRELLDGKAAPSALKQVTFVFIPVFNVDGHERFGRWNRPNQSGPEEMGWRTNAQNLNLNRDYTKVDGPETRALLRFMNEWDPILYVDLHATDGAEFQHDIAYLVSPTLAGDEDLRRAGHVLQDELLERVTKQGSLPLDFYPSFVRDDDPQSGFAVSVGPPRFSQEYWAMRNRFGVLVETHSWKDYPTRVRATRNTIMTLLTLAAEHGREWLELAAAADERNRNIAGKQVTLTYENTEHVRTLEFKGYEYTREPSAISGALMTRYDNRRPQIWRIPLRDEVRPAISVPAPRGGYVVPAAQASWMRDKLTTHHIEFKELEGVQGIEVEAFRAAKAAIMPATFEGHAMLTLEGAWRKERRDIPAGSLFVPIAQANARLLMTLMEPQDPDSFVRWGFFNAAFEQKEYMEAYVAEEVGEKMLKEDPAVRAEFNRRLADPAFAKDPAARLEFFYRRHPSWDEQYNLYPVMRVDTTL